MKAAAACTEMTDAELMAAIQARRAAQARDLAAAARETVADVARREALERGRRRQAARPEGSHQARLPEDVAEAREGSELRRLADTLEAREHEAAALQARLGELERRHRACRDRRLAAHREDDFAALRAAEEEAAALWQQVTVQRLREVPRALNALHSSRNDLHAARVRAQALAAALDRQPGSSLVRVPLQGYSEAGTPRREVEAGLDRLVGPREPLAR